MTDKRMTETLTRPILDYDGRLWRIYEAQSDGPNTTWWQSASFLEEWAARSVYDSLVALYDHNHDDPDEAA